jgi:RNA polymerase sigma-70 factor, ECF subfamily
VSDPTINQWVNAAMLGDQDAFAEIVYTFQDAVYNLCYRMLSNRGEAEDATQDTFLKAFMNLSRYDHDRSFKTWILSIASNHCIDLIRKPIPATLSLASDDPLPEHAMEITERSQQIQELLDQLDEEYRLAVVLRYWYDYSYVEIAEAMETTESAIKSRLFRARQMLASHATAAGSAAEAHRKEDRDRLSRLS